VSRVHGFEIDQEVSDRFKAFVSRIIASGQTSANGLVYGVPERWLRRPEKLNRADFHKLIEVARWA
jgi:hypothetical protein